MLGLWGRETLNSAHGQKWGWRRSFNSLSRLTEAEEGGETGISELPARWKSTWYRRDLALCRPPSVGRARAAFTWAWDFTHVGLKICKINFFVAERCISLHSSLMTISKMPEAKQQILPSPLRSSGGFGRRWHIGTLKGVQAPPKLEITPQNKSEKLQVQETLEQVVCTLPLIRKPCLLVRYSTIFSGNIEIFVDYALIHW